MISHQPANYQCPFCYILTQTASDSEAAVKHCIVYRSETVTGLVPLHYFSDIQGNVILITNRHYENIYDIDHTIGNDMLFATKVIAGAMKKAFRCEGISTRQHNEPAGNQDVWHYHLHIFPRFINDGLYRGEKKLYVQDDRRRYSEILRDIIGSCGKDA
ncbi:MAG: HIT domain-containing protein [Spirochaetes bacterium]|nr:HIT domain-containing protein [Spirochaetota bacterium]